MSFTKKTRLSELVNWRLKISTIDKRMFVGQLLSFDSHMNLILGDCEERRIPKKTLNEIKSTNKTEANELKRNLGLIILRGEQIINVTVESPPPSDPRSRMGLDQGQGYSRPIKSATGAIRGAGSYRGNAPPPPPPPSQPGSGSYRGVPGPLRGGPPSRGGPSSRGGPAARGRARSGAASAPRNGYSAR